MSQLTELLKSMLHRLFGGPLRIQVRSNVKKLLNNKFKLL